MKAIKRIIFAIFLVLVFYSTGKFVYKNKTLENDISEASFYFFKEQCGIEVEEVQVFMDWLTIGRRFNIRSWKVSTIPTLHVIQGFILDDGTVRFGWSGCTMGEVSPMGSYVLDRKAKHFVLLESP
ncbi:hypothetical protein [Caldalkalibacillus mannanilyticus]|uniref:hypothetical protein n=1 Tax=Caldalkalibacillus mannanilyticus TaxID=1418 RepID=UPI0004697D69|nr:hypothetical protein [Caldalkalibacillus mannanilyticus]